MQIAIRAYGSATSGAVPDPTLSAIDRIFDFVDGGVEKIDRVLNRGKYTEEKLRHTRQGRRSEIIEATEVTPKAATPKAAKKVSPDTPTPPTSSTSSATAMTRKPRFYIVESITPTGLFFVVTDGGKARTECSTREFAEKILRALEASS